MAHASNHEGGRDHLPEADCLPAATSGAYLQALPFAHWAQDGAYRNGSCQEAEDQIRAAVAAGDIEARGSGKRLRIGCRSFHAWVGKPLAVYPQWAGA